MKDMDTGIKMLYYFYPVHSGSSPPPVLHLYPPTPTPYLPTHVVITVITITIASDIYNQNLPNATTNYHQKRMKKIITINCFLGMIRVSGSSGNMNSLFLFLLTYFCFTIVICVTPFCLCESDVILNVNA